MLKMTLTVTAGTGTGVYPRENPAPPVCDQASDLLLHRTSSGLQEVGSVSDPFGKVCQPSLSPDTAVGETEVHSGKLSPTLGAPFICSD